MASVTEIYNEALGLLGAQKISDPSDTGVAAIVTSVYATCRQSLLESHPWNFALTRAELAQEVDTPTFEFDYQYTLPADYLRLVKFYNPSSKWLEEGGKILSDDSSLKCIYIKDVTDPNLMSPLFRKTLAIDLALAIGYTITQNNSLLAQLEVKRRDTFARAKMVDGQKSPDMIGTIRSNIETAVEIPYGLSDE